MQSLAFALIGCGANGRGHLANFAKQTGIEWVAVADPDEDRARALAAEFGLPNHYADYAQMLARHRVDMAGLVW